MCGSMVDIQSAAAEIRRGKKIEEEEERNHGKNIIACLISQGGHKYSYGAKRLLKLFPNKN